MIARDENGACSTKPLSHMLHQRTVHPKCSRNEDVEELHTHVVRCRRLSIWNRVWCRAAGLAPVTLDSPARLIARHDHEYQRVRSKHNA